MLQRTHPRREFGTPISSSESVPSLLIEMQFDDRAGAVHIQKELRVAIGRATVGRGCKEECRRKVPELLTWRRAAWAVYEYQVVRTRADTIQRIEGGGVAGFCCGHHRSPQRRPG